MATNTSPTNGHGGQGAMKLQRFGRRSNFFAQQNGMGWSLLHHCWGRFPGKLPKSAKGVCVCCDTVQWACPCKHPPSLVDLTFYKMANNRLTVNSSTRSVIWEIASGTCFIETVFANLWKQLQKFRLLPPGLSLHSDFKIRSFRKAEFPPGLPVNRKRNRCTCLGTSPWSSYPIKSIKSINRSIHKIRSRICTTAVFWRVPA